MFAEDWETFFGDFGTSATFNGVPGLFFLREPQEVGFGDQVLYASLTGTWPTSQWSGLEKGSILVGENCNWRLTDAPKAQQDGALSVAPLKRVSK